MLRGHCNEVKERAEIHPITSVEKKKKKKKKTQPYSDITNSFIVHKKKQQNKTTP